jgi:large subunit ribosomal protein L24e
MPLIPSRATLQVFRFISSKSESLFLQRKNPRKISWTVVYRRMHKKGLAEEVAKKRSRKNVKAQVGINSRQRCSARLAYPFPRFL